MNQMILDILAGLGSSLLIFILTLVFSLPLGLPVAFARMSKHAVPRWIAKIYISILRGTPLMLQLMVVYFGPFYIFGIHISNDYRFWAVLIGFSLNYAAYFAEIYRGGIASIPQGQYEAAKLLGYSKNQTFFRIILPQVIKRILPAVTNEVITLVKDTSLAFAISYTEMFFEAKAWASKNANMQAGKAVKEEGKENDLLDRIAADPAFHLKKEDLERSMNPKKYVGRAPQQVERYLRETVRPVLDANRDVLGLKAEISV